MDRRKKGSRPSGKDKSPAGKGQARPNPAQEPADETVPPMSRPWLAPLVSLVVLLAVAAFLYTAAGVLSGEFSVADDSAYIVEHGHFDRPLNLVGLEGV
jgi:hypothetical protein